GHRDCNFSCSPEESQELNGICPICKRPLVIGVDNRVEQLASHEKGFRLENAKPFFKLLPLHELLSLVLESPLESKSAWKVYNELIEMFENEFNILLNVSKGEFANKNVDEKIIEIILRNREEKIKVKPGYDGEYGKALLGEVQGKLF
ncbi:MAG: DNA helicase UvrD, partial [Nanoarchaeota archaeon]